MDRLRSKNHTQEMKFTLLNFLFFICVNCHFMIFCDTSSSKETLVIASIPWQNVNTLQQTYAPLIELLQRKLDKNVTLVIPNNYKEVGERLHQKAADIGIFGGNGYVEAKDRYPELIYLATCKQPTAFYNSLIIVRKDRGIQTLKDLHKKSFGFTDIQSTSGYIYPRMMLQEAGFSPNTFFSRTYFLNKHDKVYDAVAKGAIDGGGVSITMLDQAIQRNGDVFQILQTSAPIPRNAVVAGPHLAPQELGAIRMVLQQAENDKTFSESRSILKGFLLKDDSFYDIVRKARKVE